MTKNDGSRDLRQIELTEDYTLFKYIKGNRKVDEGHVRKLMRSMRQEDLFTPILVNDKMQIIDGQHRLEARKRLGLLVPYLKMGAAGLTAVQTINSQQKRWGVMDYCDSFIELGYKEYEVYKWFRGKYGFGHFETCVLLQEGSSGPKGFGTMSIAFREGNFKVRDLEWAKTTANKILSLERFYKGVKRRSFVQAIVWLLGRENFDFEQFARKVEQQPTALVDCARFTQYVDLIEEIYNYKQRDKVSLKYSPEKSR